MYYTQDHQNAPTSHIHPQQKLRRKKQMYPNFIKQIPTVFNDLHVSEIFGLTEQILFKMLLQFYSHTQSWRYYYVILLDYRNKNSVLAYFIAPIVFLMPS